MSSRYSSFKYEAEIKLEDAVRRINRLLMHTSREALANSDPFEFYELMKLLDDIERVLTHSMQNQRRYTYSPYDDPRTGASSYDPTTGRREGTRDPSGRPTRDARKWAEDFTRDFNSAQVDYTDVYADVSYSKYYSPPPPASPRKKDTTTPRKGSVRIRDRIRKLEQVIKGRGVSAGEVANATTLMEELRKQL